METIKMSARSYELVTKKQGDITLEMPNEHSIKVFLHGNKVLHADKNRVSLFSCGWKTNTTKTAINRFFDLTDRNAHVVQRKGVWFVQLPNGTDNPIMIPFIDGITLNF
jgi:hypothetical protein